MGCERGGSVWGEQYASHVLCRQYGVEVPRDGLVKMAVFSDYP
jgi:hypothetical protein